MPMRIRDLVKCQRDIMHLSDNVIRHIRRTKKSTRWPTEICLESTTVCNSHCRFCAHDEMIRSGGKPHKHLTYDIAIEYLNWMDGMVKLNGIDSSEITFSAVGLGEPLLCPDFFRINDKARELWPNARITMNTNCHALDEEMAGKILQGPFDQVTLSMGYIDRDIRNEMYGVERYDSVVENIEKFLKIRGSAGPKVDLHVFDVPENHQLLSQHVKRWSQLMGKSDALQIRDYMSLVGGGHDGIPKYPCYQLWSVMVLDINGYVYPCCIGTWHESGNPMAIGHVSDRYSDVLDRLGSIRDMQLSGKFGKICSGCAIVHQNQSAGKELYKKLRQRVG